MKNMIDMFCHIITPKYKELIYKKGKPCFNLQANLMMPALFDLNTRFKVMDKYEGLKQVLSIGSPPVEFVGGPDLGLELCKIANDEIAELVAKYPDRFVAGVASIPMNDMDAAMKETDRAVKQLNLKGVQIHTSVEGKPLDCDQFMPLYQKMQEYDLPLWIHPCKDQTYPDYPGEEGSKYLIFLNFGWPFETTVAMSRLVYSGILEKYPAVKFITHHCGGMLPYFGNRVGPYQAKFTKLGAGTNSSAPDLTKHPIQYFKKFYADTALTGNTAGLMCGYAFFGSENMVLGSDYPYQGGAEGSELKLKETIDSVNSMTVSNDVKEKIFTANALRILQLSK
jgi:predicted TIM-barrel fold metal-dependent hydrolase